MVSMVPTVSAMPTVSTVPMGAVRSRRQDGRLRQMASSDERQFMINENYEIYEKQGPPTGALSLHYHNFYEIIYVLEGDYSSLVGDRIYNLKKGDFLMIDCNVMHKYHYVEKKHDNSKRLVLWITRQMLERLSDAGEGHRDVGEGRRDVVEGRRDVGEGRRDVGEDQRDIGEERREAGTDLSACFRREGCAYHFPIYYEEMLRGFLLKLAMSEIMDMELPGSRSALDRGYLTLFFVYLNALCGRKEYIFSAEHMPDYPLVEEVSSYVEGHIGEPILVEELAELVHMSKYHFSRKFKELTGMTVHSFVISKRLIRACEGLKDGRSVSQVCQETGFGDYSSFLRNFHKVYGMAPGEYRDYF